MRLLWFVMLSVLLIVPANAMLQGNVQHTGNYSASAEIIPKVAWKTYISGLVDCQPLVVDGRVFVSNWYGWKEWKPGLYCLNAENGEILWRNPKVTGASSVAYYDGKLYVGNLSGDFFVINATNGEVIKEIRLEDHPSWWGIASSPIIYNGSVYVTTFSNGTLWKLDLKGNVLKKFTTGGTICPYVSPTAFEGRIFFAGNSSGDRIYCVDENLSEIWNYSVDSQITGTPTVGKINGSYYLIFTTKKSLYVLDLNGNLIDRVPLNGTISSPAVAYNMIYVGAKDGLYCFKLENGLKLIWKFKTEGKVDSSPAVANGVVYFATNVKEGTLYALNAFNGNLLWFYRLKPPQGLYYNIMSSPFIYDDRLYIGTDSGYVYCFDSSGTIEFNVTLSPKNVTITIGGKRYEVREDTALGALLKASKYSTNDHEVFFNVTLDDSWYEKYGSFLISSIMGLGTKNVGGKWIYWSVWNETSQIPVGANLYYLSDGETIYYRYGDGTINNSTVTLKINAEVSPIAITGVSVTPAKLCGNATAYVNVSSSKSGWFVLVVSGLNDKGDYIAGISTFHLSKGGSVRVPVLIHIPQRNSIGTYKLYAGVYELEGYPNDLIEIYGPVKCEVSS